MRTEMANAAKTATTEHRARGIERLAEALGDMGELFLETAGRGRSRNRSQTCPNCGG